MKLVILEWDDVEIDNDGGDGPYTIVFIKEQSFIKDQKLISELFNILGDRITIEVKQAYNENIILKITLLDTDKYFHYDTNKTIIQYPFLNLLKEREVSGWSVGYRLDGEVRFLTPVRLLIS